MDFYEEEGRDAVRLSWNVVPNSKLEAVRIAVPLAVHYTPLANIELASLEYTPHTCKCEAVLNKFTPVNFMTKNFLCQFCGTQQQLPASYSNQITPEMLPYEMTKECSTFECQLTEKATPRAYLFVMDLCMITEEEFIAVKEELVRTVGGLPQETFIGLITFNKFVHVHELTAKINTVYCVSGSKDYTNMQVLEVLGMQIKNDPRGICHDITKKFIVQIGANREKIMKRIKDIKLDQLIYVNERPLRATSSALNIAITLAESSPVTPRIITFVGGPCTIGAGKVIEQPFEKMMRTQNDIYKGENCENYVRATKYYEQLAKRLVAKKIVVDIFGFCLDQFGLLEMKKLVEHGGGFLVMQEEFKSNIFRDSFQKV